MKHGRSVHTIQYRLLSLLMVLTLLSSHMVPLSYATGGDAAGEGLLAPAQTVEQPAAEEILAATEVPSPVIGASSSEDTGTPPAEAPSDVPAPSGVLICEKEVHDHDPETCWQAVTVCGMEEDQMHIHEDACYEPRLICQLPEQEAHTHEEDCYGITETFHCGKTESEAHAHTVENGCYTPKQVLDCEEQLEAHQHSETCTVIDKNLTCELSTEPHVHDDSCRKTTQNYTCTLPETQEHKHDDGCLGEPNLICEITDPAHTHEPACYTPNYVCGLEETEGHTHEKDVCYTETTETVCGKNEGDAHVHGEECYTATQRYTCGLVVSEGHEHNENCYKTENQLTCEKPVSEGHTHTDECKYGLICTKTETEGHQHNEACYVPACSLPTDVPHKHEAACYSDQKILICQLEEHTHGDDCYQRYQITDLVQEYITVSGNLPVGVTLRVTSPESIPNKAALLQLAKDVLSGKQKPVFIYDISLMLDGEEYQPAEGQPVFVTVEVPKRALDELGYADVEALAADLNLYHVHGEQVDELTFVADYEEGTLTFEVSNFSVFIGTVQSATSVYLVQQLGYTFYQGDSVLSAKKLEWKTGVAITVKPDTGWQLNNVAVVDKETGEASSCSKITDNGDGTFTIAYVSTPTGDLLIEVDATQKSTDGYVYFDLSAGKVTITGNHYVGYRYDGQTTAKKIEGDLGAGQSYYVYQSDGYISTGLIEGEIVLPEHDRVTYGGKSWGEYITNNTDVNAVIGAWNSATSGNRAATRNLIDINGKTDAVMIIDSLWSSDHKYGASEISGGIRFIPGSSVTGASLTLYLKGDNRFGNVFYNSSAGTDILADNLLIFDGDADATLTAANLTQNTNTNYWRSAIGGNDGGYGHAKGIVINNGIIYAGTTVGDDCTAIGGGGNDQGIITINGGTVTAVCSSSGTAIGGGIGKNSAGGQAAIFINGGKTYAYNFSCASRGFTDNSVKYIPAAAIGGGSSGKSTCNKSTVIITGGEVYAQSVGGTAIGGGSSADTHGGDADIIISGGKVYAKSVDGYIDGQYVPAGAAIGGGTGGDGGQVAGEGKGGNVTLTISGDAYVETGSIGGGSTINEAETIGYATVTIDGGETYGQIIMAEGSSDHCTFTMTGGELHQPKSGYVQLQDDGAAVWMDDSEGIAAMSGGTISGCTAVNGGTIYMTAGTFTLSDDGEISGNRATGDGGAVYMGGGVMNIRGGSIKNNSSANDGGAIYMGGGELNISGGEISNNTAAHNGGGAYVNDGNIYMSGGEVSNNTATSGAGGGMYVSADKQDVEVKIFSGKVLSNTAATGGGAVAVYGAESGGQNVTVQTGVEETHTRNANGELVSFTHGKTKGDGGTQYTHAYCPEISENFAGEKGGAIHIKGNNMTTNLNIYCMVEVEKNNVHTEGDKLSSFLMVDGGKVVISTAKTETEDEGFVNEAGDGVQGSSRIQGTIHVSGGQVDLYGVMTNPKMGESISVDITKGGDYFRDHRYNDSYYKLQYFENFTDPVTKVPSGRYTAYDVEKGSTRMIEYAMYSHPGYELIEWNTKPDGTGVTYKPAQTVELSKDLTLYGIWEANVYWVEYDPNTNDYGGEDMPRQQMAFNAEKKLAKNTYERDGYRFTGWKDANGNTYTDEQVLTEDLTLEKDEVITLYAQWTECDHNPSTCTFTYTAVDDTLYRVCKCNGLEMAVSLTAPKNAVYTWDNGAAVAHPARKTGPNVNKGIKHSGDTWDPTVYYAKKVGDAWVPTGAVPDTPVVPTDAGTYAAVVVDHETQLSASSVAAYVIYTIDKAVQPAPEVEGVEVVGEVGNQKIKIKGTVPDSPVKNCGGSDIITQYQVYYYTADGANAGEINTTGEFTPPVGFTNYYVEVWYTEGDNYKESTRTETYPVFYVGKAKIEFDVKDGIGYTPSNTNATGVFTIDVYAKEGYYLTSDFKVEDNHDTVLVKPEIERQRYSISGVPEEKGLVITVTISGAALKTGITATVAEKREYDAVLDPSVTVSRDSAFTMAFEITNYNPAVYSGLKLTMEKVLPIGSTILMMDKSKEHTTYWAYKVETENLQEVLLNSFVRMGGIGTFAEPTGTGVLTDPLCYQFVVDCSWSDGASVGDLGMKLTAGKSDNGDTVTPEFAGLYEAPTVSLAEKETFALENIAATTQGEMRQSLKLNYTAAGGAASCWEGRAPALVLTLPETSQVELPAGTQLKYTFRSANEADGIYATSIRSFLSSGGKQYFIMPLTGLKPGEKFPGQVDLVLLSDSFPIAATTYSFEAQWIYSRSGNAESPMDGDMVAEATAEFAKSKTFVPNVTVSTANDKRLYTPGETLHLSISSNIDPDFKELTSFKVELLRKVEGGSYATTAWNEYVGGNSTVDILLSPELTPGSYCVRTTVIYANQTALQVPFYFVIQKADGAVPDTGGNSTTGGDPTTGETGGNGNEATGETGNEAGTNG